MRNRQEALDWEKANAMSLWKKGNSSTTTSMGRIEGDERIVSKSI
ncbi:hypothetical protein NSS94_12260 [Paenibacillus sp. FSL L8-0644]